MSNCGLNNKPTICRIFASFEEVIATSIPAYSTMFNSVVSTSFQFGLKLVMSSTFLVVQPQHATLTVEAPKTDAIVSEPASPEDDVTVTQNEVSTTATIPPSPT